MNETSFIFNALIPAREFDEIIKDKNILPFGSSNLLEHKINQLQKTDLIENIYVSTDSDRYKDIAIKIGKPNSARAVANACGQNPDPITRPCHRVICSNGEIGGYSAPGGAEMKKKLLEEEQKNL